MDMLGVHNAHTVTTSVTDRVGHRGYWYLKCDCKETTKHFRSSYRGSQNMAGVKTVQSRACFTIQENK